MSGTGIVQIEKPIPFGAHLHWWLRQRKGYCMEAMVSRAEQYERPYLAWEQIRKGGNPFLEPGTGFEGYFVGACSSADEAFQRILEIGRSMLSNISRLHRFEPRYQTRLLDTLLNQVFDFRALIDWSAEFGAELARLRCTALRNPQAEAFRVETYHLVDRLPHITYTTCDHLIKQRYCVVKTSFQGPQLVVSADQLNPSEQVPWLIVQAIGKLGHPLLREFMDLASLTCDVLL